MDARSQRKLRFLTAILSTGALGGIIFVVARVGFSPSQLAIGIIYGVLISGAIGTFELLASSGPLRDWLGSLPLTANLAIRSAFYAAV
ncbi:MAG TPA: adenylate/guanylate cyclase domain-containing protein, partial [Afipia sp.]|nr:adenylate/guanylate cyclase domain-containing protein [Afipia sp.]